MRPCSLEGAGPHALEGARWGGDDYRALRPAWPLLRAAPRCARGAAPVCAVRLEGFFAAADRIRAAAAVVIAVERLLPLPLFLPDLVICAVSRPPGRATRKP
ncbi:hypothetical protein FHX34_103589 [Actinoplanes teichomyceticus]|uniref:Uncharacterized protein n=1 Tax=Actinoplanes teichomyceticus TaxID=1867 RepID=A0A561WB27_ACTTI|nr:hypothetical protein FHX34_103589 [Actinoplanes teichomyceticus]GIF14879.1 hypothetical protein Ate01nite_49110 [Actinoplanes teichomyceticus]